MINVKILFVLLASSLVLLTACTTNDQQQETKPGLELTAQLGGIIYLDTAPTIHISTTLLNPTNDTAGFITMTCSYEDMFLTDTAVFRIQSRYDCYGNYPAEINIPPHSKLDQFLMVRPISKDIKVIDSKIKIGLYYIQPKKENGFEGIIKQYENRQKAMVLWSNELDLKRLYRKIYK